MFRQDFWEKDPLDKAGRILDCSCIASTVVLNTNYQLSLGWVEIHFLRGRNLGPCLLAASHHQLKKKKKEFNRIVEAAVLRTLPEISTVGSGNTGQENSPKQIEIKMI